MEQVISDQIAEAAGHFKPLYSGIEKGFITISTFGQEKLTKWFPVSEYEAAAAEAIRLSKSENVYYGVGIRKEQLSEHQRGSNKDISYLPGIWLEVDITGGVHASESLPDLQQAKTILNTPGLEPSIVIFSGGGLHCYWLFDRPVRILTDKERESAQRMLKRFQGMFIGLAKSQGLHIDNTSDLARVLRVPGTFNLKGEKKAVKTLKMNPETRYSLEEIKETLERVEGMLPKEKRERRTYENSTSLPDAKPEPIIEGCNFIQSYLGNKDSAPYAEWMAALSIGAYCEEPETVCHEWSWGHKNYSEAETDKKIAEIRANMKPRTCASLSDEFGKCASCIHNGKINSPIALGMRSNFQIHIEEAQKWQEKLEYGISKQGEEFLLKNGRNIELILENCIGDKIGYNEFADEETVLADLPWRRVPTPDEWKNADFAELSHWFDVKWNIKNEKQINNAFVHILRKRPFHPIKDHIEGTKWDGELRIPFIFSKFLGVENTAFSREIAIRFFTGAVKRVYQPGCKHDWSIVLVGGQGLMKSWLIEKIAVCDTFGELTSFDAKDGGEQLRGKWILEIPELAAKKRSNNEEMKAFMSRRSDDYRAAYARKTERRPRQAVLIGTSNDMEFITDETGDRRNVPLVCQKEYIELDIAADLTPEYIAQLWAEAKVYFDEGKESYLDKQLEAELSEMQTRHKKTDPLQDEVLEYAERIEEDGRYYLCVREIWDKVVADDPKKKPTRKDSERIVNMLTSLGYIRSDKKQRCGDYGPRDCYFKK